LPEFCPASAYVCFFEDGTEVLKMTPNALSRIASVLIRSIGIVIPNLSCRMTLVLLLINSEGEKIIHAGSKENMQFTGYLQVSQSKINLGINDVRLEKSFIVKKQALVQQLFTPRI
jgi:hypothetical protein